ncbi:MAG TPA: hypothetical protein VLK58_05465 [Conexibacter sp.]|nr:hypothetical protein [Conexibacter sp.]
MEDQQAHSAEEPNPPATDPNPSHGGAFPPVALLASPAVSIQQRYRMRTPSTGREVIIEADPDRTYVDRETGEDLEVVAQLLPLAPTPSDLPWTVANLRICNWCDQFAQKDLNDCPTCGRRMAPIGR